MSGINTLIYAICSELQISSEQLWKSNQDACVDARCVLCTILGEWGMTDTDISKRFGLTRQGVNKLRNGFYGRHKQKWNVRQAYREGKKITQ